MKRQISRSYLTILLPLTVISALLLPMSPPTIHAAPANTAGKSSTVVQSSSCSGKGLQNSVFTLDNVTVNIHAPYLPPMKFDTAHSGDASQVAIADCWNPFREFSVTAVPYGTRPGTENVPVAYASGTGAYRSVLFEYRLKQGGNPHVGPIASIFGEQVAGLVSLISVNLNEATPRQTLIVEWVVEAGNRIWIVRFSQEQTPTGMIALNSLADIVLSSSMLTRSTTLLWVIGMAPRHSIVQHVTHPDDLPNPGWWKGTCDTNNYANASSNPLQISAYPLGATYQGLIACGPRPIGESGPQATAHFFSTALGVLEWGSLELSMRYMYLNYGIHPYPANGSQVVWNYQQSNPNKPTLVPQGNNSVGQAPQQGDILSYGPVSTNGHTSVVMSTKIDGSGNGSIIVIEQNAASSGTEQIHITNWVVGSGVSGWLHHPGVGPVPGKLPTTTSRYPSTRGTTTSRYMSTVDPMVLKDEGCSQAKAGEAGVIILDFGGPAAGNGVYGTYLFSNNFATTDQIAAAAEAFLQAFWDCMSNGQFVMLGIGTSNYGSSIQTLSTASSHGWAWGAMVEKVEKWIRSSKHDSSEVALGASDMELSYNTAANTRAWADGYARSTNQYYLDYGDAAGCPPFGQCTDGWTPADVVYVSWGAALALPFPEIYNTTGANAREWQQLSLYAVTHSGHKMRIQGSLTQFAACQQNRLCDGTNNTPAQGWTQLQIQLNSDKRTAVELLYASDISWVN